MCNIFCNHFSYTYTSMYWSWQTVTGYSGKTHANRGQVPANNILFCFPFIPSFSFFNHGKWWRINSNVSTIMNMCGIIVKKKNTWWIICNLDCLCLDDQENAVLLYDMTTDRLSEINILVSNVCYIAVFFNTLYMPILKFKWHSCKAFNVLQWAKTCCYCIT